MPLSRWERGAGRSPARTGNRHGSLRTAVLRERAVHPLDGVSIRGIAYNRATLAVVAMSTHPRRHLRAWHVQSPPAADHAEGATLPALKMSRGRFAMTHQRGDRHVVVTTGDPCSRGATGVRVQTAAQA